MLQADCRKAVSQAPRSRAGARGALALASGAALAAAILSGFASSPAAAPPYPRLMTMLWASPEPKDFAPASRFDVVEFSWTNILGTPGYEDSVLAMKARNPGLKVIGTVSCDVHCSNWPGREAVMSQWTQQMTANDSLWWLRDTDGDYFKTPSAETTCTQGWMNFTQIPMARAFAEYLYQDMFVEHPGVFDGVHFDQLVEWIAWLNSWRWASGGVDSIDADRDGIADRSDSLNARWAAGTAAFCQRFRELAGNQYILFVNGSVPQSVFPLLNGRFHEGFPGPVGNSPPDWYKSMFDPKVGYLPEQAQYSSVPQQMITLHGLSFYPYDCDPLRLSTTDAPNDSACDEDAMKLTVASALLGDGYACFTGFGRPSSPPGADPIYNHTTWWFPLFDTLRVNLGTPVGAAYDSALVAPGQTTTTRWYTGGVVHVTHLTGSSGASPAFDLKPKAAFPVSPTATPWVSGDSLTIRIHTWDPLVPNLFHKVRLLLSRNGGASYAETLKVQQGGDSLMTIEVPGPPAASCRVRLEAKDFGGLKGWADSGPFAIVSSAPAAGIAEATPTSVTAGAAAPVTVSAKITSAPAEGIVKLLVVRPATLASWSATSVDVDGAPLAGTLSASGDTVRVTPAAPWAAATVVRVHLSATAATTAGTAASVGAFLVPGDAPTQRVALAAGDADGVPGDSETLSISVAAGPAATLVVSPAQATVGAGASRAFSATATDAFGNAVTVSTAWSVLGGVGSISPAGLFLATTLGSGGVVGTSGALRDTSSVTVVAGAAARVVVSPDSAVVSADTTARFSVSAFDAQGNATTVSGSWSVTGGSGSIDATGLFTPQTVGRRTVRFTAGGLLDSAGVTVVVGVPSAITVLPTSATIPADSSGLFTATVTDRKGNARSDAVVWSVLGGIGSVDGSGRFTPGALGSGGVVGTSGALRDTSSVTVVAGKPARLVVSPDSVGIVVGGDAQFAATFRDVFGAVVAGGPVTWSVTGPGALVSAGRVRGTAAGAGRVIARSGALSDTAAFGVSAPGGAPLPRLYALTVPSGPIVGSPSGRLGALHVEARATRGGAPDSTASADSLRLLLSGGGPCAAETLRASAVGGQPGAFAFDASALAGCANVRVALLAKDLASPVADTVALRSPDQDGSGTVSIEDVAKFLAALHASGDECADLDADGAVTVADIDPIASELGTGCSGPAPVAKQSATAPFAVRFAGARSRDTLGLAPAGWDLVDGSLWCAGGGGFAALYLALHGEGRLVSVGPPASGRPVTRALAADGDAFARCLAFEPVAPASAADVEVARIRIAVPAGRSLDSLDVEAMRVDGAYGVASASALAWQIAAPPADSTGGSPPDSSRGTPPDSSGGTPPDSSHAPHDSSGVPPDSSGAPHDSSGTPIDSTLGTGPTDSTGSPGDSTGGSPNPPPVGGSSDASTFRLMPPQPNPARFETTLRFVVPERAAGPIHLSVYDSAGRLVVTIEEGASAGEHEVAWYGMDTRGRRSPPGVYFVRLDAPAYSETQRVILLE